MLFRIIKSCVDQKLKRVRIGRVFHINFQKKEKPLLQGLSENIEIT